MRKWLAAHTHTYTHTHTHTLTPPGRGVIEKSDSTADCESYTARTATNFTVAILGLNLKGRFVRHSEMGPNTDILREEK